MFNDPKLLNFVRKHPMTKEFANDPKNQADAEGMVARLYKNESILNYK